MENLDKYPDFKDKLTSLIEEQGPATVGFNAALALASLLDEKGIVEYEEFVDKFYEMLSVDEEVE